MNFHWLSGVSPRWGAVLHAIGWVALVVWVFRLPREELLDDAPDRARWRDLRLWVLPLAVVQVALYFVF